MLGGNSRNRTHKRHLRTAVAGTAAAVFGFAPAPVAADDIPDFRPEQWGLISIGAPDVWEETQGEGTTVALPGFAVVEDHPDLRDNLTVDTEFGEGGDEVTGTAAAALVAAHGHGMDADGGVLGAAPDAALLALPTEDDLPGAVRHAANEGAPVILLPENDGGDDLAAATEEAAGSGALVVGPADGGDDPNVLAVAGVDEDGALIPDSAEAGAIDLTAPGADLDTADPELGAAQVTGTPYAAAMAAGAAALLRTHYPQLGPAEIRTALVEGSQQGPDGLPALHVPTADAEAGGTAEDVPMIDEDLADRADEGGGVPVWAWFASIGAVLVLGVLLLVVWVRRSSADPYGVKAERAAEDERIAAERAAESGPESRRRQKGGRRRKPRRGA
ncbi:subtilase family protein [Nocardiopsis sp. Huas11]|uniref:S8 family serine peptidase n=1 Tax=Nocardiopsis sp. Huas11 TaxID=2183912 RepID=UPI000F19C202|nr:S8 family serine peptidase [Nocardiopsis sp. Huas11]RKS05875.1 subtilase family protein [Nocardiopsis sp. Huas11]